MRVRIYLIFLSVLCLMASGQCWATPGFLDGENPADFSDYVPYDERDDTYDDESFMYWGKNFGVSLGSGIETFSGAAGKLFQPAVPIFDFRLISFSDRWATQFGLGIATHHGNFAPLGATDLRILRAFIDFRYYFAGSTPAFQSGSNALGVVTPAPWVSLGFSYLNLAFEYKSLNQTDNSLRISEWDAPIFGKLPFPWLPSLAVGLDFALAPRSTSLALEGRWLPLGSYFGDITLLDDVFHEKKIGDLFFVTAHVVFAFD